MFVSLPSSTSSLFAHVLSAFSMKKYPDKTTFNERSLFSVLTVFTTKLHCTMNNNFFFFIAWSTANWIWTKNVRIGNNDLNNRRLIEYAIAYCNIPPLLEMMTSVTRKLSIGFLHPCALKLEHIQTLVRTKVEMLIRKRVTRLLTIEKKTNDILVMKSYYSYNYLYDTLQVHFS